MSYPLKTDTVQKRILETHLRVLAEAVKDVERYDIRSSSIYDALDWIAQEYLQARWPCCQFKNALEVWSPQYLQSAWYVLNKSLKTPINDL